MPEQANPLRRYELMRMETLGLALGDSVDPMAAKKSLVAME
jgi:hypothetical protein